MRSVYRHAALVRLTHWLNAGFALIMLMSGLQIFNAHPALYIGRESDFERPVLEITNLDDPPRGVTKVFGMTIPTTGVLGLSRGADGEWEARGFPAWATIPGPQALAEGRRWHFLFAFLLIGNAAIYWLWGLLSRHVWRDVTPSRADLADLPHSALEHLRLRFDHSAAAYNPWQKLAYFVVVVVIFPLLLMTGLTMSPRLDAQWPWLLELFGGRQTARSIHFLMAFALVGFVALHLIMVLVSGVWNNLRSMITGRYALEDRHAS